MDNEYLIKERPLKAIAVFTLPLMLAAFFQQFYTLADSAIVARFVSEKALAAIGASYALTNVFISIAIGAGTGSGVIISRYYGARDYHMTKNSTKISLISFLLLSIILAAIGLSFSKDILLLLNTPLDILDDAKAYLDIYFMGLPFLFCYNALSSCYNALGKSRYPLFFLIFSSILNIVLDLVAVIVFQMGLRGAAWATLISQAVSALLSFILLIRLLKNLDSSPFGRFSLSELKKMSKIALPSILQQSTVSIGMMLVQGVINSFGSSILAGYSAAMRLESIATVPFTSLGNAASSYAAQNIGANKRDRIKEGYKAMVILTLCSAFLIFMIFNLFKNQLISIFIEENSTMAYETASQFFVYVVPMLSFIGLKMITDGILKASGNMLPFTIANIVNLSIRVVLSYLLAPVIGFAICYMAVPLGWIANFIISGSVYFSGKWKKKLRME